MIVLIILVFSLHSLRKTIARLEYENVFKQIYAKTKACSKIMTIMQPNLSEIMLIDKRIIDDYFDNFGIAIHFRIRGYCSTKLLVKFSILLI